MKIKLFLLIIISGSFIDFTFSQSEMTIREVFDFGIGDIFQTRSYAYQQPPNADTRTVIGKWYSANNDTVFYDIYREYYTTMINPYPQPHLDYTFGTDTIQVFYTDLDSSIYYYMEDFRYDSLVANYGNAFEYDTIIEYSQTMCNILTNGFDFSIGDYVEPDYYRYIFGKGTGLVSVYANIGGSLQVIDTRLNYFKKDTSECGTPDTTTFVNGNAVKDEMVVYPNPALSEIRVITSEGGNKTIALYDLHRNLICNKFTKEAETILDISGLPAGIYFVKVQYKGMCRVEKVVKVE